MPYLPFISVFGSRVASSSCVVALAYICRHTLCICSDATQLVLWLYISMTSLMATSDGDERQEQLSQSGTSGLLHIHCLHATHEHVHHR